jgi:hypothetical protein
MGSGQTVSCAALACPGGCLDCASAVMEGKGVSAYIQVSRAPRCVA